MFFVAASVLDEVQYLLSICYKYKNLVPRNSRRELKYFAREIEHCYPRFSAADCLDFNHKCFLALFANIATYLLAFVEFNKAFSV